MGTNKQVVLGDVVAFIQDGLRSFAKPELHSPTQSAEAGGVPSYMRPTAIVSGASPGRRAWGDATDTDSRRR